MQGIDKINNFKSENTTEIIYTCSLIGSSTLLSQCAEILLQQNYKILNIFSNDAYILEWAKIHQILCYDNLDDLSSLLKKSSPDWLFSIVNPKMLSNEVISLPTKGSINYHDSLLPAYAGANATAWAIINRESEHGISWHLMDQRIDSGGLLRQRTVELTTNETSLTLNAKCYDAAIKAFQQLVGDILEDQLQIGHQDSAKRSFNSSNKRPALAGIISWQQSAVDIEAMFRALSFGTQYQNRFGMLKILIHDQIYIVTQLQLLEHNSDLATGSITSIHKSSFDVTSIEQQITIEQLIDIQGNSIKMSQFVKQLEKGEILPELNHEESEWVNHFHKTVCLSESYWVQQLASLNSITLPFISQSSENTKTDILESINPLIPIDIPDGARHSISQNSEHLITAFCTYLARLCNESQFSLAFQELEKNIPEVFSKSVPLNITIDENDCFSSIVSDLQLLIKTNREHQTFLRDIIFRYPELNKYPFEHNVDNLPVLISKVVSLDIFDDSQAFTLALVVNHAGNQCALVANENLLKREDTIRIAKMFTTFLGALENATDNPVWMIPLLTKSEQMKLTQQTVEHSECVFTEKFVHQFFERWAKQTPDALAISFGKIKISYSRLNQMANHLANRLVNDGIGAEKIVGICLPRTVPRK